MTLAALDKNFQIRTFNENSFKVYLITECANSQTEHEPQGGEEANAELDD